MISCTRCCCYELTFRHLPVKTLSKWLPTFWGHLSFTSSESSLTPRIRMGSLTHSLACWEGMAWRHVQMHQSYVMASLIGRCLCEVIRHFFTTFNFLLKNGYASLFRYLNFASVRPAKYATSAWYIHCISMGLSLPFHLGICQVKIICPFLLPLPVPHSWASKEIKICYCKYAVFSRGWKLHMLNFHLQMGHALSFYVGFGEPLIHFWHSSDKHACGHS